ncbi:hypothetical protein Tco_0822784 [Tanacetum coccineum]|uniref:Uncharacterized protein n=1 Tax=Tanacetum coccineum TaxID=301880 RepID=A0ABQ5AG16_9ASTR
MAVLAVDATPASTAAAAQPPKPFTTTTSCLIIPRAFGSMVNCPKRAFVSAICSQTEVFGTAVIKGAFGLTAANRGVWIARSLSCSWFCPSFTQASNPQLHFGNPISKSYRLTYGDDNGGVIHGSIYFAEELEEKLSQSPHMFVNDSSIILDLPQYGS